MKPQQTRLSFGELMTEGVVNALPWLLSVDSACWLMHYADHLVALNHQRRL